VGRICCGLKVWWDRVKAISTLINVQRTQSIAGKSWIVYREVLNVKMSLSRLLCVADSLAWVNKYGYK
jgi:hypothetical protein